MELLSEHLLEVGSIRAPASPAEQGDARAELFQGDPPPDRYRVTIGVSATDIVRFGGLEGQEARLLGLEGREVLRFRLEEVDTANAVVTGVIAAG